MIGAGGGVACACTWIAKAASEAESVPSLALITIFENVPTLALVGVPERRPVELLKLAQDGGFFTENVRVLPCGSLAVGLNE